LNFNHITSLWVQKPIVIKLNLRDANSGEIVLPAYFSDEYFTLMPGEIKNIQLESGYKSAVSVTISAYK